MTHDMSPDDFDVVGAPYLPPSFALIDKKGFYHKVEIDWTTGEGRATPINGPDPTLPADRWSGVDIKVDPEHLRGWQFAGHISRILESVYNGGQSLSAVLTAPPPS